jgi:uncharacterized sulfatase
MAAIDVLPTVAALVGVDHNAAKSDGFDLSSALLGTPTERPAPVFWEYGVHGSIKPGKPEHVSPQLAVRDGDWKLLCNPDGSELKLFNLHNDIGEVRNLAEVDPKRVSQLKAKLMRWWEEMDAYYDEVTGDNGR